MLEAGNHISVRLLGAFSFYRFPFYDSVDGQFSLELFVHYLM